MSDVELPGRLGDPNRTLGTDPRADPRVIAALAPLGLDGAGEPPPFGVDAGRDELLAYGAAAEEGFEALFAGMYQEVPPVEGVQRETLVVPGGDDNDITLYVHRPSAAATGAVYHIHGGGMVLLEAAGPAYSHWRDELASRGLVVIGVEYRNGAGKHGPHPYPAGLNDCVAGLRYVLDHRDELGVSHVVVSGESGGGNLTIATTLRAKQLGWAEEIAGVYAQCPYISGTYGDPPPALVSLVENDTYFLRRDMMALLVEIYDPGGAHATEPTCWPYHATAGDVAGLPPHVISVNELDPLRDEGLAYLHTLWAGGVAATGRVVPGTSHAFDVIGRAAVPDVYAATQRDLVGFVGSVGPGER